jgi:hypothetical protein
MAANCCDELMACAANEDCLCMTMCIGGGGELEACVMECELNPNQIPDELMAIRVCQMTNCGEQCAMP